MLLATRVYKWVQKTKESGHYPYVHIHVWIRGPMIRRCTEIEDALHKIPHVLGVKGYPTKKYFDLWRIKEVAPISQQRIEKSLEKFGITVQKIDEIAPTPKTKRLRSITAHLAKRLPLKAKAMRQKPALILAKMRQFRKKT